MEIGELPRDLQELVLGEVRNDEKLLWSEQPDPNKMILSGIPPALASILVIMFAVVYFQRAYPTIYNAFGLGECPTSLSIFLFFGLFVTLCGILFALVGLLLLTTPFLKKVSALKTVYVLTNKRAICFNKIGLIHSKNDFKGYEILTYFPDKLINMQKIVRKNGSGDLVFVEIPIRIPRPDFFISFRKVGFLFIKNVDNVEDLIRKTLFVN